jgi:UDP-N-acetyl-D-glucosamine dehydrogenase
MSRRPTEASRLGRAIRSRRAQVGVIGLGYVGLPLARLFASKGFHVVGFDVDPAKVEALNRGRSYILTVPSGEVGRLVRSGRIRATADFAEIREIDAVAICVPTPLTQEGKPDLSYIRRTGESIAPHLRSGRLVVLESTTYPGTTREVLAPALAASGLKIGEELFVAYSPEREDPGSRKHRQENIPKVVGGLDPVSRGLAAALYGAVVARVVPVSSCEAAEAAKLLENIYRCVNIAMVNELKMLFDRMKIDVFEVIAAAATKPFGFQAFYPGPGWGGHCIPIDPFYLAWKAREYEFQTRFIELAGEINRQMPFYVVARLEEALQARGRSLAGAKVLVLGAAYKRNVDDPRESPAFPIMELLLDKGGMIAYHDPYVPKLPRMRGFRPIELESQPLTPALLRAHDAAVIVTDHSNVDYRMVVRHSALVVDSRNVTAGLPGAEGKVVRA